MTLEELRDYTRTHVLCDVPDPQQWLDESITTWLNDAESIFARRTFCFMDAESDFCSFDTAAGIALYDLDPLVLSVRAVSDSAGAKLHKYNSQRVAPPTSGKPIGWVDRTRQIMLWPSPDDVYTISLLVARFPLVPMSDDSDTPEIPEQYHLLLCDWAGYRALRTIDAPITSDARDLIVQIRRDWERGIVEARREYYQRQRG